MDKIAEAINTDLLTALKNKEADLVRTLRLLKTALESKIKEKGQELSEADVLQVIKAEAKKRKDSIESFLKAGRDDLRKIEEIELEIIKKYLPPEMTEAEVQAIVEKIIQHNSYTQQDFGQVMKAVMAETKNQADGGLVAKLVKQSLK